MVNNNVTYFERKAKADAFNNAFLSSLILTQKMHCYQTLISVFDVLTSLATSKATNPDGISAKILKETAVSMTNSLTRLIQLSLSSCKFTTI